MRALLIVALASVPLLHPVGAAQDAPRPLGEQIATDPARYRSQTGSHGGPGSSPA